MPDQPRRKRSRNAVTPSCGEEVGGGTVLREGLLLDAPPRPARGSIREASDPLAKPSSKVPHHRFIIARCGNPEREPVKLALPGGEPVAVDPEKDNRADYRCPLVPVEERVILDQGSQEAGRLIENGWEQVPPLESVRGGCQSRLKLVPVYNGAQFSGGSGFLKVEVNQVPADQLNIAGLRVSEWARSAAAQSAHQPLVSGELPEILVIAGHDLPDKAAELRTEASEDGVAARRGILPGTEGPVDRHDFPPSPPGRSFGSVGVPDPLHLTPVIIKFTFRSNQSQTNHVRRWTRGKRSRSGRPGRATPSRGDPRQSVPP